MLALLFKRFDWDIFGVKIIAAQQGSAKTNIAFFCCIYIPMFVYIYMQGEKKAFSASENLELETVWFGIKSIQVHFNPMSQFIN